MPSIYVASLSDYNAGHLHGEWVELDEETTVDDVHEAIRAMLRSSRTPPAEEFAIHDQDGFGSLRLHEYEAIERVVELAHMVVQYGADVVAAYVDDVVGETSGFTSDELAEAYRGEYESKAEFAYSLLVGEGLGFRGVPAEDLDKLSGVLDWDAIADELSDPYDYVELGHNCVLVFDRP